VEQWSKFFLFQGLEKVFEKRVKKRISKAYSQEFSNSGAKYHVIERTSDTHWRVSENVGGTIPIFVSQFSEIFLGLISGGSEKGTCSTIRSPLSRVVKGYLFAENSLQICPLLVIIGGIALIEDKGGHYLVCSSSSWG